MLNSSFADSSAFNHKANYQYILLIIIQDILPLMVSQIPIKFGNNKKHIDLFEVKWYNIFGDEIWVLPLFSYQLNVTTN